jgi:hypothetical protein
MSGRSIFIVNTYVRVHVGMSGMDNFKKRILFEWFRDR